MSVMKKILVLLLSFAMLLGVAATAVAADDSEELVWYDCDCAHTHTDECYDGDALICEKEELHVHTKACFEAGWPNKKKVFEPICGKENVMHSFSCMTKEALESIIAAYPQQTHTVKAHEAPYVFSEVQTYLSSGVRYHDPASGEYCLSQMFMLADLTDYNEGDSWTYEGGKRYEAGVSNYAIAYCCDVDTGVVQYTNYRQINLEDSTYYTPEVAEKIRSVMMNGYPYNTIEELQQFFAEQGIENTEELDEVVLLAATQMAIWSFANSDSMSYYRYWQTTPSSKYPIQSEYWHLKDAARYQPELAAIVEEVRDCLVDYANKNPEKAPEGQVVLSHIEVTNLVVIPNEDDTYTLTVQVSLNMDYTPTKDTDATITVAAGNSFAEVEATGGTVYTLVLDNYVAGTPIDVSMQGTQYLPLGVYFYEPYTPEGMDVRDVSQNLVGLNVGAVAIGDSITLDPASLTVNKVSSDGQPLNGAEFTLYYIAPDDSTGEIGTYTVTEQGTLDIDGLIAGAKYRLVETKAPEGYVALNRAVLFTVSGDGEAKLEFMYQPDDVICESFEGEYVITVVNSTTPPVPVYVDLSGIKYLDDEQAEGFSFSLMQGDTVIETVTSGEDGSFAFSPLAFDASDVYYYTVVEADTTDENVVYDNTVYTVRVTVTRVDGVYTADVAVFVADELYEKEELEFYNTSVTPTTGVIEGTKFLDNEVAPDFSFILSDGQNELERAVSAEDGIFRFTELTFDKVGTYVYTVYEVIDPDNESIVYDESIYTVTFTVEREGDALKVVSKVIEKEENVFEKLEFYNDTTVELPDPPPPYNPPTGDSAALLSALAMLALVTLGAVSIKKRVSAK